MPKHHYFYVVHFLSASKGVGNQTINVARLPLALHAPILPRLKKSHDALPSSLLSLFIFTFIFVLGFFVFSLSFHFIFFYFSKPIKFEFYIFNNTRLRVKTTNFFFHFLWTTFVLVVVKCIRYHEFRHRSLSIWWRRRPLQRDSCSIFLPLFFFATVYFYIFLFVCYVRDKQISPYFYLKART